MLMCIGLSQATEIEVSHDFSSNTADPIRKCSTAGPESIEECDAHEGIGNGPQIRAQSGMIPVVT